jgi:hypothetical protein
MAQSPPATQALFALRKSFARQEYT